MTEQTDSQTSPPLPAEAPIAAASIAPPAPVPVPALPYLPQTSGRPGILTGIGVTSIVIASISILTTMMSGCYSMAFFVGSRMSGAVATSSTTTTTTGSSTFVAVSSSTSNASAVPSGAIAPPAVPQPPMGEDGLKPEDRRVAIDTLNSLQALSDVRQQQLDYFLAQHGQKLFPTAGRSLTAPMVRATINFQANAPTASASGKRITFVGPRGTLIVEDDQVAFQRPGIPEPIITTMNAPAARPTDRLGYSPLTAGEAQQVAQIANQIAATALNPAQSATLVAELQKPSQQLLQLRFVPSPISFVSNLPDGSVMIQFNQMNGGSMLSIDAKGMVTQSINPAAMMMTPSISSWAAAGVAADTLLSLGLAVLLLVAGIQVIRQAGNGRKLHRLYAWVKIPVALLGWAATSWLGWEWFSGIFNAVSSTSRAGNAALLLFALIPSAISCAYPIVLLIVFRSKRLKDYYNVVQA